MSRERNTAIGSEEADYGCEGLAAGAGTDGLDIRDVPGVRGTPDCLGHRRRDDQSAGIGDTHSETGLLGRADQASAARAWLSRALAPRLSYCARCRTSFFGKLIHNDPHSTNFAPGRWCFPLCEKCWAVLTPSQRLPYYDALVNRWIAGLPENAVEYDRARDAIREAVLAGG